MLQCLAQLIDRFPDDADFFAELPHFVRERVTGFVRCRVCFGGLCATSHGVREGGIRYA
jgi:hypothetical protein